MNTLVQEAVLVGLSRRLVEKGSWAGETHIQKAAYLLSELGNVDFDFDFILYKHGPFSFELRDELERMNSEGVLASEVPNPKYGARLMPTPAGRDLESILASKIEAYSSALESIAELLGKRGVMELERLATAMWMTKTTGGSVRERAEAVVEVKPHIPIEAATASVEEVDRLLTANT